MADVYILPQYAPLTQNPELREIFCIGGRGGGRSINSSLSLLTGSIDEFNRHKKPINIACLRSYQTSLKDSYKKELVEALDTYPTMRKFYESGEMYFRGRNAPVHFVFKGLNIKPDEIKSLSQIKRAVVEEADSVTQEAIDALTPTIRQEDSSIWWLFNPSLTTTPMAKRLFSFFPEFSYCHEAGLPFPKYSVTPDGRVAVIVSNSWDNPLLSSALKFERDQAEYWASQSAEAQEKFDNIWRGRFRNTIEGAYYQNEIARMLLDGRMQARQLDYDLPYYSLWDLGLNDYMVAWIVQKQCAPAGGGSQWVFIDCLSARGMVFRDMLEVMAQRGYTRHQVVLPHDGGQKRGYTVLDTPEKTARSLGLVTRVIPVTKNVYDDIQTVKGMFCDFVFNNTKPVRDALDEVKQYAPKIVGGVVSEKPDHAHSDFADPLRLLPAIAGAGTSAGLDTSVLKRRKEAW